MLGQGVRGTERGGADQGEGEPVHVYAACAVKDTRRAARDFSGMGIFL
jgi:hypothetical protein